MKQFISVKDVTDIFALVKQAFKFMANTFAYKALVSNK